MSGRVQKKASGRGLMICLSRPISLSPPETGFIPSFTVSLGPSLLPLAVHLCWHLPVLLPAVLPPESVLPIQSLGTWLPLPSTQCSTRCTKGCAHLIQQPWWGACCEYHHLTAKKTEAHRVKETSQGPRASKSCRVEGIQTYLLDPSTPIPPFMTVSPQSPSHLSLSSHYSPPTWPVSVHFFPCILPSFSLFHSGLNFPI